jgi:hypothetical protein
MHFNAGTRTGARITAFLLVGSLLPCVAGAQALTGSLIGTVKDQQGGVLPGATVRITSPALMGGVATQNTNEKGQLVFPVLPPGVYALDVDIRGFGSHHEGNIRISAGATLEVAVVMRLAGVSEAVHTTASTSRVDARDSGLSTVLGPDILRGIPSRRNSLFQALNMMPGISPTSPSSSTVTTVSAFGSGTNENMFLLDGLPTTCPCNGVPRSEFGIDFMHELQLQSIGASAEFGGLQGAVVNVVTRQGSNRFLFDTSYYGQPSSLTSQPVRVALAAPATGDSGFGRARYHDFTANLGGPAKRDRIWFFTGYQFLRDSDSQPGTDPNLPRKYEQNKIFVKLNWKLRPGMQLMQSFHDEIWLNSEPPTIVKPIEATQKRSASVPAITFGHLTHILSPTTVWDVRVGRFVHARKDESSTSAASRFDRATGVTTGAPSQVGNLTLLRTSAKATLSRYQAGLVGADHQLKIGGEIERGESRGFQIIPTGVRYVDDAGRPFQAISSAPSVSGGMFVTAAVFATDAITFRDRLTINAGLRFDRSRAISQDLPALDAQGNETGEVTQGLGTLYVWNVLSPRVGITLKLTADGRTILRSSYGRLSQGVLTGELGFFHPGVSPVTTMAFDAATGGYTRFVRTLDSTNLLPPDETIRPPHTDEYSVGIDRAMGGRLALSAVYVHKSGTDFIGWTDVGGQYREEVRTLPDGRQLPVFALVNSTTAQKFFLTNPDGYSLSYDGVVMALDVRQARGWQASGSYTYSRVSGLQASSGATASGAQVSTVAPPPAPSGVTFGQDRNDLTNARGRMPNDRPHVFRVMGIADIPRTGIVLAANFQYFTGKPWAASTQVLLPQGDRRILLETRGSRRLSAQSLLDFRVSKTIPFGPRFRAELMLDILNALNDMAEEGLASDDFYSQNFGKTSIYMDPRRVMLGVRFNVF